MLSMQNLLEPITIKALINEVNNYFLWERLYIVPDKNLLRIKHTMENHIRVEEASITRQRHQKKLVWPNKGANISIHKSSLHHAINNQQDHPKEVSRAHSWPFDIPQAHNYTSYNNICWEELVAINKKKKPFGIPTSNEKWFKHKEPQKVLSQSSWSWKQCIRVPYIHKRDRKIDLQKRHFKKFMKENDMSLMITSRNQQRRW